MKTRIRETEHESHGSDIGISRRLLLRGVVGSAAAGLLITIPSLDATASTLRNSSVPGGHPPEDILWLFGSTNRVAGYTLQAVAPNGSPVTQISGINHAVARTQDGQFIVDASATAGQHTTVRVFAASSGQLLRTVTGAFLWPQDSDLAIAIGSPESHVVISGTYMSSTTTGATSPKVAPDGSPVAVPLKDWTTFRCVEVLDFQTGKLIASTGSTKIQTGQTTDLLALGSTFLTVSHGADGASLHGAFIAAPQAARTTPIGQPARTALSDPKTQRAYLMTSDGNMTIVDSSGNKATAGLRLNDIQPLTAKPFGASVVATGPDTVAVIDASRRYLASIDAMTGAILAKRSLNTSESFAPGNGQARVGVAADPQRKRIYVTDPSGVKGGVWVHDATTLEVLDRWHSDVQFGLVWVAPTSGTVYLQSVEGPIAVHDPSGHLTAFAPSPLVTTKAL